MHRDMEPTFTPDVFWIFVLWRALHGQDATLAEVAAAVIAGMWQFLPSSEDSFGMSPIVATPSAPAVAEPAFSTIEESDSAGDVAIESFSEFGDERSRQSCELFCDDPCEFSIHHNYFKFKGVFYRVDRPAFACLPTAA